MSTSLKELQSTQRKLNKLQMQKSRLVRTQKHIENNHRKARTRTMIQVGGVLQKSGLLELFEISPGDDLQGSTEGLDKARNLLGFLLTARDQLKTDTTDDYYALGKAFLR